MSVPWKLIPNWRVTMAASTMSSTPIMAIAASHAAASYRRSRARLSLALPVGIDHGLAVGTGFREPVGQHHVADLLQLGTELRRGLDDVHALGLELVHIPLVLFFAEFPAAR